MNKSLKIAMVSNYINHHQIPFCNAMNGLLEGSFTFVQTEKMEEQRVQMGWSQEERPAYVKCFYEEEEVCRQLILDCDIVLFGGTDEESYIVPRLEAGKPVIRYSERLYKTGQWKAVSPRGLKKKYHDHTRYRKSAVYLLCSGAYVASDFHIIRAYPGKMYRWGYFPETRRYDVDRLLEQKGQGRTFFLLWAGRMIDWKHPELAVETARRLQEKELDFHLDMIGDGPLKGQAEKLAARYGLGDRVSFLGYQSPETVRGYMEKADIFLFTSDRQEGWGAVLNEAMNSGCAVAVNHMIGAAPYLICNGVNGCIYEDGKAEQLFDIAEKLARDKALCRTLGKNAYRTIVEGWNAERAAGELIGLIEMILDGEQAGAGKEASTGEKNKEAGQIVLDKSWREVYSVEELPPPCSPAPLLTERAARRLARSWRKTEK